MRYMILAIAAAVLPTAAFAAPQGQAQTTPAVATSQDAVSPNTLLPGRLDIPLVEGSRIPTDCHFPQSLQSAGHYDLGCVVMPRGGTDAVGAQYLGMLGQRGWHQGELITGGFSAIHAEANGCERVMGIYPSEYPPRADNAPPAAAPQRDPEEFGGEDEGSDDDVATDTVLWFAYDQHERCHTQAQ